MQSEVPVTMEARSIGAAHTNDREHRGPQHDGLGASIQSSDDPQWDLLRSLAIAPRFADAANVLMDWCHWIAPTCSTRVVWGDDEFRGAWDRRLGKLSKSSRLFARCEENWRESLECGQSFEEKPGSIWVPLESAQSPAFEVNGTRRPQYRCVLWIEGEHVSCLQLEQQITARSSIGGILASRPWIKHPFQQFQFNHKLLVRVINLLLLVLLLGLIPIPYPVSCSSVVQPFGQRMIAAPFEATLLSCDVAPGDEVHRDDVLLRLDGRPLNLELESLRAEHGQALKEQNIALAAGKIADGQLASLKCKQLESRIALLEERLASLDIRSPIRGVVVSGDLKNSVGTPFKTGDALLEVAPLDRMRIELEIPEDEVHQVAAGNRAQLRLNSSLFQAIEGKVTVIYPEAEIREEKNCFVAIVEIENKAGQLRPGMRGTAVVYGPRRPYLYRWVRRAHESLLRTLGW